LRLLNDRNKGKLPLACQQNSGAKVARFVAFPTLSRAKHGLERNGLSDNNFFAEKLDAYLAKSIPSGNRSDVFLTLSNNYSFTKIYIYERYL
jgi:hypothetical protein